jgi:hypothetical protein
MSSFNDLYRELTPLKLKLASEVDYQRLRFNRNDIIGFFDEKLIHVWNKYHQDIPYEEVKAIAITSLYNLRGKVYRIYSREVSLGDTQVPEVIEENTPVDYIEQARPYLSPGQFFVLDLLINPPMYILSRIHSGKRIPSRYYLEFLDFPVTKHNIKRFNTLRRGIFDTLRQKVSIPEYA